MAEITVKIGRKIGRKKVDLSKVIQGKKPTQEKGVAAQGEYWTSALCPVCYVVVSGWANTEHMTVWFCWNSGNYFEV